MTSQELRTVANEIADEEVRNSRYTKLIWLAVIGGSLYMISNSDNSGFWFVAVVVAVSYFLPAIVAANRRHNNRLAIFVLNLFAGWTFVGWVVAMVWSCTSDIETSYERIASRGDSRW